MPLKNNTRFCGAKARRNNHKPCMQPAMKNGRCRLHGGKATGAKTESGRARAADANYKHGFYTKAALEDRKEMRAMMHWRDDLPQIV